MYVPVTEAAALRRCFPRTVIGKLQRLCEQPNITSNNFMTISSPLQFAVSQTVGPARNQGHEGSRNSGYENLDSETKRKVSRALEKRMRGFPT
jgi:hypothetical protein